MKTQAENQNLESREAFSMEDLPKVLPFGRRSLDRMISSGAFPKPDRRVGRRRIWARDTIKAWLKGA